MAYEIEHRHEADYRLFQFQGPTDLLQTLQRTLRLTDGVLRHRLIKLKPGTPPPPQMRREPRVEEAPAAEGEAAPVAAEAAAPAAVAEAPAPEAAPTSEPEAAPEATPEA